MPAAERVGHRLDPVDRALQCCRIAIERPPAQELDLHDTQAAIGEDGLHLGDIQACCLGSRQVVGVHPDAREPSRRGRPAPLHGCVNQNQFRVLQPRCTNEFRGSSPNPAPVRVKKLATSS